MQLATLSQFAASTPAFVYAVPFIFTVLVAPSGRISTKLMAEDSSGIIRSHQCPEIRLQKSCIACTSDDVVAATVRKSASGFLYAKNETTTIRATMTKSM